MTAVHPAYQKRGIMGQIGVRLFVRRFVAFYIQKFLRLKFSDELWFFIRTCNPVPYRALQLGQVVYPDLIGGAGDKFPQSVQVHLENLKILLDIPDLDTRTGVVPNGALNSGIVSGKSSDANFTGWHTSWSSWVPEGSELMMLIPVPFSFPLRYGYKLARSALKLGFSRTTNSHKTKERACVSHC
jgi:hypothetical protein